MKRCPLHHRLLGVVPIAAILGLPTAAQADVLVTEEAQITSSSAHETSPRLSEDPSGEMVVYTSQTPLPDGTHEPGDIMYQRLNADGTPKGDVVMVSNDTTDDMFNDVSGHRIVYTAFPDVYSFDGHLRLYDIDDGSTFDIIPSAETVREARIDGDVVVWTQGLNGTTRVQYFDLKWPTTAAPITLGGTNPAARKVEIGDRYVVWERTVDTQHDIMAYDRIAGEWITVSADPDLDECRPTTSGDYVVYQTSGVDGMTIKLADMSQDPVQIITAVNNGADVERPTVDGDLVAYETTVNGNIDVYLYRISDGATFQVTDNPDDQMLNNLYGHKVSYVDNRADSLDIFISAFSFDAGPPPDPCENLGGDADGDQICQDNDNCPGVPNTIQTDTDSDTHGDVCDNCVDTWNPSQADTDKDELGDLCDSCPNDPLPDVDMDAICGDDNCPRVFNPDQADDDDDGMGDVCDACPFDDLNDEDGDGYCGNVDNCPDVANDQTDWDLDGLGDACDDCPFDGTNDADEDGFCDDVDNCLGLANDQTDSDFDGLGDDCDDCPLDATNDADNDGICNDIDLCPGVPSEQIDSDFDGLGDACDDCPLDATNDPDNDGFCDNEDNCLGVPNDQTDSDFDGLGDACDPCPLDAENDADNDGICDDVDPCPGDPANTCGGTGCLDPIVVDFETDAAGNPIPAGALIHDQYAALGLTIDAENNSSWHAGINNGNTKPAKNNGKDKGSRPDQAITFDSSNPTGGDWDLRTPGSGTGNTEALGNLLVVADDIDDEDGDGLVDDPGDENKGGWLIFTFATPMTVSELTVIDIENEGAVITTAADGGKVSTVIPAGTDNSVQTIVLDSAPVISAHVAVPGSGAVDRLTFCAAGSGTTPPAPPAPPSPVDPPDDPDEEEQGVSCRASSGSRPVTSGWPWAVLGLAVWAARGRRRATAR